jgi:Predicted phosphohydrolase (DHH superfamily)
MKDVHPLPFFEPEVVLYHADCPDGFGAAWAVWTRCPAARFVTARHGQPPPDGLAGKRLVIVDFSYARPTIEQLAGATSAFAILDHHVTAQQALGDLPYAHYEQNKSGAVLAWEWAHRTAAPWLLQYVQDKDLHRWQLPESREINQAIESYPFDFDVWSGLKRYELATEGRAILRAQEQLISKLLRTAVLVRFEGETIPAVHSATSAASWANAWLWTTPFVSYGTSVRGVGMSAFVLERVAPMCRGLRRLMGAAGIGMPRVFPCRLLRACRCCLKSWPRISDKEPMRRTNRLACIGDLTVYDSDWYCK